MIRDNYSFLPIIVGALNFATCDKCKDIIVINTVVLLTTDQCLAQEGKIFMNRCMFLCKCKI